MRRSAVLALCALCACARSAHGYSGTVQTEFASVGSQIGGRVVAVEVQAGSRVHRGQVLVRLDPAILGAERDEARQQVAASKANLEQLRNGAVASDIERARGTSAAANAAYRQSVAAAPDRMRSALATRTAARADERLALATYERTRSLLRTGDVSKQSYDEAASAYEQARARTAQADAQYQQLLRAQLPGEQEHALGTAQSAYAGYRTLANGTRPEEIAQAQAQVGNAVAAAARAQARLDETIIRSPVDGVVSSFDLHPGDMLAANQTAAIIDSFADPYAYIYVAQRDLARIRDAKRLIVRSDAQAGSFNGAVEAYDRNAQFTPQNVETADQRAELVYGMKVRIDDPQHRLLDGTTVTVEVP